MIILHFAIYRQCLLARMAEGLQRDTCRYFCHNLGSELCGRGLSTQCVL